MKKLFALILLSVSITFTSCEVEDEGVYKEQVVVDGFMFVDNPLMIKLTHTVPVGEYYDENDVAIEGAEVMIAVDDRTFQLTESTPIPGTYFLPADSHVVTQGKIYDLTVIRGQDTVRATTKASEPLQLVGGYPDTLEYGGDLYRIQWDHDSTEWGFGMLIQSMEEYKYGDGCDFGNDNGPGVYAYAWTVRNTDIFDMPWVALCYTGRYQVQVFACDEALWNYLNTFLVGDADYLPISNIQGGQGLFCAVGRGVVQFYVTDDIED